MTDIRKQLQAAFEIEHREHLQAIRAALDNADRSTIDMADVFRRAHSLKGAARAVDLPAVEEVAHRLEALFARVLDGQQSLDDATTAEAMANLDTIEDLVAEALSPPGAPATGTAAQERKPPTPPVAPASPPAPSQAESGPARTAKTEAAAPAESGSGTYLRVASEQMEQLSGSMYQLLAELQAGESLNEALRRIEIDVRGLRRSWDTLQGQILSSTAGRGKADGLRPSVNTAVPRLRDFDQDLKALFRRLSALARNRTQSAWSIDQAARRLRDDVERVSLIAAETVFGGFGHMVREIAREEGRDVHVRTIGLDLQVDRQVLQALKDPVMHLLRNALSHGVEPAAERSAKGKPERGEIVLELASRGGRLVVSVRDDGRGPDLARIERVAVERGLLAPRAEGAMAPMMDQLLSLVFVPGFSTAGEVDRLSGRGIGLSVVAEAARRLHGSVLMRPRFPWGTEILLNVPFTAARQSLLLVEAEDRMYGLPSHAVARLLRLPAAALESVEGRPTVRIEIGGEDVVVPVIAIAALTGSPHAQIPIEAGNVKAVLVRHGARHCALAVNAFHDVRAMLVSDVDAVGLGDMVSGTVLLEDEMPALVLSPDLLIEHWVKNESHLAAGGLGLAPAATDQRGATTILVVDDSITTRTLEKSILEAQGYRVLLSVDGIDALNVLRSGEAMVDLVIADVEMPRMDGFGLLQAVKTDPRIASTPVILMTSRADPEDVRRGLDLGASAYITKQKFDQRELLATIGQLL
ncbi:hybrid sensor histidine kinase/response regulator [Microvirga subterranea]|uniref:Chemotaxis protein CheA n=1 Tax=Microvirga subterranea TaxID=186651 RepID=A0A370HVR7_9HYPH|nr:response regulator [Microvirga subterranea]RDI62613.1 two-component system chemotaxis sensor kinase CheA [Microvirga subterranea]